MENIQMTDEMEELGDHELELQNNLKLFLTKFVFWGYPIAIIISLIFLIIKDWIVSVIVFGFLVITLYLVEQSRKYLRTNGQNGFNPTHLDTVYIICSIFSIIGLVFTSGNSILAALFLLSGLLAIIFNFKAK